MGSFGKMMSDARSAPRPAMTDAELADFLGIAEEQVASLGERRVHYEHVARVCLEIESGRVPPGVIVCRPRERR